MKKIIAAFAAFVLVLSVSACTNEKPAAQEKGQKQTEQAFSQQSSAVPYPADQLRNSLERQNLRERLLRTNKPDAIGYVYLLSFGQPLGYYVVKGKVSSTQSQMTTSTLVERHGDGGGGNIAYEAPGDDGSYGQNEPGIFFFLTNGTMVTTDLDYVWADQPLPLDVPNLGGKK